MTTTVQHKDLAGGRWHTLTLCEQMGNIGSEVSRAARWQSKGGPPFDGAVNRALELFDLTLADPRLHGRRKEISRSREVFCDTVFNNSASYGTSLSELLRYFDHFALAARQGRNFIRQ